MTKRVVDRLKAIKVDVEQAHAGTLSRCHIEQLRKTLLQQETVWQVRQRVMVGEVADPLLVTPTVGKIV